MDDTVVPVVIIGAGPTGLVAAALLARHGVRSLLLERHADVYPLPRAVHLDDEVMRILQRAGVAEAFQAVSRPALGMRLVDRRLRTLAEFRRDRVPGEHGWAQTNLFDQPDLERLLRANLRNHPEVEFRCGAEVVHIDEAGGAAPVRVTFRDANGESTSVRAQAVLGCDGANSLAREFVGAAMRDLRFTQRWLVVDARCSASLGWWDGVHQVCGADRAATFMRLGADRYRWEFRLAEADDPEDLDIAELLTPWCRGVSTTDVEILRRVTYTFRAQVADRWRRGRVFLLGDAAHLTPPFIGQGMGAGLRDAANLTWKLALVLHQSADGRLLDTYRSERRPHATRVIHNAIAVGWAMTGGGGRTAGLRQRLASATCRVPGVTALASRTVSPRLRRGQLIRRRIFADHLPGTLIPQAKLDSRPLDDVLGDGFAVVTARRLGPEVATLVRPDRVVLAAAAATGNSGASLARAAATWLPLLPPSLTRHIPVEETT